MRGSITSYFNIDNRNSTISTEIIAGCSTFLSVAYIFIVSPSILAASGIDLQSAFIATAIAATLGTLAMGLWANLPFAVAPGLTMSSYFSFVVVKQMGFTWQQALATVFLSGVLCFTLTALPVRRRLIESIPLGLKRAIATMVGIFVASIGLLLANVITSGHPLIGFNPTALDPRGNPLMLVLLTGLILCATLGNAKINLPGATIVAIIGASIVYWMTAATAPPPAAALGHGLSTLGQLDFSVFASTSFILPMLVFFILDFFEGVGEFIGLTAHTSVQDPEGNVPHLERGLYIDGIATSAGALLGVSSLIIFVESAVGIKAGGRTGLTAVTCAILMGLVASASYFAPAILVLVPAAAAAGVLIFVGITLIQSSVAGMRDHGLGPFDLAVSSLMAAGSFLSFSLDKPLAFGFAAYFLQAMLRPGGNRVRYLWLGVMALLLTLVSVYEYLI